MKLKHAAANAAFLLVSLCVGLIGSELALHLVLNPADYLSVTMIPDPILGITVAPNSAGYDAWGFRNPTVPQSAQVVALGDSHTFGNTVKMNEAWPTVVGEETGLSVYNLALGGYGPNQYFHLLTSRALSLHPKYVICGLYMGDDFENAFSTTYGLEHWAALRKGQFSNINANIWRENEPPGAFKGVRNWLSRKSMVYRLVVHGPLLASMKARVQFDQASGQDPFVATLESPDGAIKEAFHPKSVAVGLDQTRPEVKEGMRITFELLTEMNRVCRDNGCTFGVVIIPTKETVFAKYLESSPELHLKDVVESVITNEQEATAATEEFLERAGILYVNALPALRSKVAEQKLYYAGPADVHPNAAGQRVIGTVAKALIR